MSELFSVKIIQQADGFAITSNGRFIDINVSAGDLVATLSRNLFIISQKEIDRALKILESSGAQQVSLSLRMKKKGGCRR